MAYSIDKFKKMLNSNGIFISRSFTINGLYKFFEINVPKSGNSIFINIPDEYKLRNKGELAFKMERLEGLGFVADSEEISDVLSESDGGVDILRDELEDIDALSDEEKEVEEKEVEDPLKTKDIIKELRLDIEKQMLGESKYDLPDEEDEAEDEAEDEYVVKKPKRRKRKSAILQTDDIVSSDMLAEYDTMVYEEISGKGPIVDIINKVYKPIDERTTKPTVSLRKTFLQLERMNKIIEHIDYEICRINTDYIFVTTKGIIEYYQFKNNIDENTFYIVINLEDLLQDLDHLHKEVPIVLTHIHRILKRGITIHSKTISKQVRHIKDNTSDILSRINKREKYLQNIIGDFRILLDRLNREENNIFAQFKINERITGSMSNEINAMFKSKDYQNKLHQISSTKQEITFNIIKLQKDLDNLFIVSDSVLYDNILLSHTYTANQNNLNNLLNDMEKYD